MITAGLMGYFESAKTIHNIGFSIWTQHTIIPTTWKIKRSVLPL
jgi:hypothetical protein